MYNYKLSLFLVMLLLSFTLSTYAMAQNAGAKNSDKKISMAEELFLAAEIKSLADKAAQDLAGRIFSNFQSNFGECLVDAQESDIAEYAMTLFDYKGKKEDFLQILLDNFSEEDLSYLVNLVQKDSKLQELLPILVNMVMESNLLFAQNFSARHEEFSSYLNDFIANKVNSSCWELKSQKEVKDF